MDLTKKILLSALCVMLFFLGLEVFQRVRYSIRYREKYWLFYGFTAMPNGYMTGKYQTLGGAKDIIELNTLQYDGYRKQNPLHRWEYGINSNGFRGKEIGKKERYRIVVMGGSTTFCVGVPDGFTYPEYLERVTGVDVINAGIGASTITEISNLFKKEIIDLKPDMVIISNTVNNLMYYGGISIDAVSARNVISKINIFLLNRSFFYITLREKMAYLMHRTCSDIYKLPVRLLIEELMTKNEFWDNLKNKYIEIIALAKRHNIKVVIVKEPIWLRKNHGLLFDEQMVCVYDRISKLYDTLEVPTVDAYGVFNKLPDADKERYYGKDGLHLTKEGNEYLAKMIAETIMPLK